MAKIALVDLDGVLNDYTGKYNEQEIPKIKNGAKEFLIGHIIFINQKWKNHITAYTILFQMIF